MRAHRPTCERAQNVMVLRIQWEQMTQKCDKIKFLCMTPVLTCKSLTQIFELRQLILCFITKKHGDQRVLFNFIKNVLFGSF